MFDRNGARPVRFFRTTEGHLSTEMCENLHPRFFHLHVLIDCEDYDVGELFNMLDCARYSDKVNFHPVWRRKFTAWKVTLMKRNCTFNNEDESRALKKIFYRPPKETVDHDDMTITFPYIHKVQNEFKYLDGKKVLTIFRISNIF